MKKEIVCFLYVFLFFRLGLASNLDWDRLQERYSKIQNDYNSDPYDGPNCWGVMFYTLGYIDRLVHMNEVTVKSFLNTNCEKLPDSQLQNPSPGTIVVMENNKTPQHSYLVGPDKMAWQKFDQTKSSLIQKEPHLKVMDWFLFMNMTLSQKPIEVSAYSCKRPNQTYQKILNYVAESSKDWKGSSESTTEASIPNEIHQFVQALRDEKFKLSDAKLVLLLEVKTLTQEDYKDLVGTYLNQVRDVKSIEAFILGHHRTSDVNAALIQRLAELGGVQSLDVPSRYRVLNVIVEDNLVDEHISKFKFNLLNLPHALSIPKEYVPSFVINEEIYNSYLLENIFPNSYRPSFKVSGTF